MPANSAATVSATVSATATVSHDLPPLADQADRLIEAGLHELLGHTAAQVRAAAARPLAAGGRSGSGLLVPNVKNFAYPAAMELVAHAGRPGFVVEDFRDVDEFSAVFGEKSESAELPVGDWYVLADPRRGDEYQNDSPAEALAAISQAGRVPLTMVEGIVWLLQRPDLLERNACFMTIGSRKAKAGGGFDARTPALWISNGTGRDGVENRNAPKLGWCWWNNRHTWLGIAHAASRSPIE